MGESWDATEYSNHGGTCWVLREEAEAKLAAARAENERLEAVVKAVKSSVGQIQKKWHEAEAEAAAERERADGWEGLARDYARRLGERVASPPTTEMLKFNGVFVHPADPETGEGE